MFYNDLEQIFGPPELGFPLSKEERSRKIRLGWIDFAHKVMSDCLEYIIPWVYYGTSKRMKKEPMDVDAPFGFSMAFISPSDATVSSVNKFPSFLTSGITIFSLNLSIKNHLQKCRQSPLYMPALPLQLCLCRGSALCLLKDCVIPRMHAINVRLILFGKPNSFWNREQIVN